MDSAPRPPDTESLYSVASAGSVYSNAGGIAGHLNVTGEMLLSMMYDIDSKNFILRVHKAKGNIRQLADHFLA